MIENTEPIHSPNDPVPAQSPPAVRQPLLTALRDNPVVLKELRSRMRGSRAFIIITVYLTLLSCLVSLVYASMAASYSNTGVTNILPQTVGKSVFGVVVGIELLMVCFLAPALTAGAIAAERERQTFDLLRATLLPARSLVWGKLFSAMSFLLLLLLVGFPIQSLAFVLGGISVEEVLVSFLMLLVTAFGFSALGLFISSLMRTTLASTVVSYVGAVLLVFGVPLLLLIAISFFGSFLGGFTPNLTNAQQLIFEFMVFSLIYMLVVSNPLATLVASELMFTELQAVFYGTLPLSNGGQFPVVSPWITYSLLVLLLSGVFIGLSIRQVRRAER